jgi:hypothetical protein
MVTTLPFVKYNPPPSPPSSVGMLYRAVFERIVLPVRIIWLLSPEIPPPFPPYSDPALLLSIVFSSRVTVLP